MSQSLQHHDYQQQPQQQQQQHMDASLLLKLPGPALRRVLQLASTSYSPAVCRLSCASKAFRQAAEAAAAPVDLSIDISGFEQWMFTPGMRSKAKRHASVSLWLDSHWHLVRKLHLEGEGPAESARLFFTVMLPRRAAAAASGIGLESSRAAAPSSIASVPSSSAAASPAAAAAVGAGAGELGAIKGDQRDTLVLPLQQLHVMYWLSPDLASETLATFEQLQVLSLSCNIRPVPRAKPAAAQYPRLLQALSQLRRLQMLSLEIAKYSYWLTGDMLLLSMPPSLKAVDLFVPDLRSDRDRNSSHSSCSSSSLAHLVHLTSLRLNRFTVTDASNAHPATQQQQQAGVAAAPGSHRSHQRLPWQQVTSWRSCLWTTAPASAAWLGPIYSLSVWPPALARRAAWPFCPAAPTCASCDYTMDLIGPPPPWVCHC